MKLGRKKKIELDPNVQFPKRRETDIQAEMRAEQLGLRRKAREDDYAWITRREVRAVKKEMRGDGGKLFSITDRETKEEILTRYGAKQKRLRRATARVARRARAVNFRREAVARRQRQKRRRQGR